MVTDTTSEEFSYTASLRSPETNVPVLPNVEAEQRPIRFRMKKLALTPVGSLGPCEICGDE